MYSYYPTQFNAFPTQTNAFLTQNIQYVNDRQSAEAYQLPVNSSVILMDSNRARFYMKQTDASGASTIKTFDFKEAEEDRPAEYVTKTEFNAFKAELKGVENESVVESNG